jgi:alpha-ketoglutarate-dependent taurine dioxygenase
LEDTVMQRKEAAERVILNTFSVLRNSHYGLMSTWSASDSWKLTNNNNSQTAGKGNSSGSVRSSSKANADKASGVGVKKSQKKSSATPSSPSSSSSSLSASATTPSAPDGDSAHLDGAWAPTLLDLHTDGTYFLDCPKLQAFGCIYSDPVKTVGGETTLADGFSIAGELAEKHPNLFRLLTTVPVGGRYEKEGKVYEAYRPVITLRPTAECITRGNVAQHVERISFNNSDRIPLMLGAQTGIWSAYELRTFYHAYYKFHELSHSPEFSLDFTLRPGQLLFFDNHRVLHGRLSYTGPRVMCGAYVGSDEYYSSLKADGSGGPVLAKY